MHPHYMRVQFNSIIMNIGINLKIKLLHWSSISENMTLTSINDVKSINIVLILE